MSRRHTDPQIHKHKRRHKHGVKLHILTHTYRLIHTCRLPLCLFGLFHFTALNFITLLQTVVYDY
jgi:hypothetical protein